MVQGYYDIFNVVNVSEIALLAMHHIQSTTFANISAGIVGKFENTNELKVMNYKEAINGPDGKRWKAEVENKYQQMLTIKVFKVVLRKDLPSGTKLINSIWAITRRATVCCMVE